MIVSVICPSSMYMFRDAQGSAVCEHQSHNIQRTCRKRQFTRAEEQGQWEPASVKRETAKQVKGGRQTGGTGNA